MCSEALRGSARPRDASRGADGGFARLRGAPATQEAPAPRVRQASQGLAIAPSSPTCKSHTWPCCLTCCWKPALADPNAASSCPPPPASQVGPTDAVVGEAVAVPRRAAPARQEPGKEQLGAPATAARDEAPPFHADFLLVRKLGRGTFGFIYAARRVRFPEAPEVAVKVVSWRDLGRRRPWRVGRGTTQRGLVVFEP